MDPSAAALEGQRHSAFYCFVPVPDVGGLAEVLHTLAKGLLGTVVVASEGVSGALAGSPTAVAAFENAVQQAAVLGGALRGMPFKHSDCTTAPFARLKISVKPEIVALGLPPVDPLVVREEHAQSSVSPQAWRQLLARDDVVVLDNRNHFEFRLGHFQGAVDPQVHNFRDFVEFVQEQAPAWRAAGRPVAMYCTGGVRCEKTAPWMRSLGLDVFQLDGGILSYCEQMQDANRDWIGECFVFDNRIALDAALRESAATAEQVFDDKLPDEAWRLQRARRLDGQGG